MQFSMGLAGCMQVPLPGPLQSFHLETQVLPDLFLSSTCVFKNKHLVLEWV